MKIMGLEDGLADSNGLWLQFQGESYALFWPSQALHACGTQTYITHTHKIKIINLFKGKTEGHCVFHSLPLPDFELNIKIYLQASRKAFCLQFLVTTDVHEFFPPFIPPPLVCLLPLLIIPSLIIQFLFLPATVIFFQAIIIEFFM